MRRYLVATAALAALMTATAAYAGPTGSYSVSGSYGPAATDFDGTPPEQISVAKFVPPGVGDVLTSVVLTETANITTSGTVAAGAAKVTVVSYTASMNVGILLPGSPVPKDFVTALLDGEVELDAAPTIVTLSPGTINAHASKSFGPTASSASAGPATLTGGDLSTFEGIGDVIFPVVTGTTTSSTITGGNLTLTQSTSATADLTVTYNWEQRTTNTPEPMTLSLLGAGLVGLAVVRRRAA